MTRQPDVDRKPAMLEQILDHLLDKPLSSLSFRTLATALDVSTFTLVYHFGTRAQLVSEIVSAISTRAGAVAEKLRANPGTIDAYIEGLEASWEWAVQPRSIRLQRLEFEAALLEAHEPDTHTFTREVHGRWQQIGRDGLHNLGLSEQDADTEARLAVATFFGLQYDLLVNGDVERTTIAFRAHLDESRARIERLMRAS